MLNGSQWFCAGSKGVALSVQCVARNVNIGKIVVALWSDVPSFLAEILNQLAFTQVCNMCAFLTALLTSVDASCFAISLSCTGSSRMQGPTS